MSTPGQRRRRFSAALVAKVRKRDPEAIYWPGCDACVGDAGDVIELSPAFGGGMLPNRARAERWLASTPALPADVLPMPPPDQRPIRTGRARARRGRAS